VKKNGAPLLARRERRGQQGSVGCRARRVPVHGLTSVDSFVEGNSKRRGGGKMGRKEAARVCWDLLNLAWGLKGGAGGGGG
jgi:hypothetical protein